MVLRLTTLHWATNMRSHFWEWPVCSRSKCREDKWVIPSKIMYLLKTAPARLIRLNQCSVVEQWALVKAWSCSTHGTERRSWDQRSLGSLDSWSEVDWSSLSWVSSTICDRSPPHLLMLRSIPLAQAFPLEISVTSRDKAICLMQSPGGVMGGVMGSENHLHLSRCTSF